jgi:hypothetical protein
MGARSRKRRPTPGAGAPAVSGPVDRTPPAESAGGASAGRPPADRPAAAPAEGRPSRSEARNAEARAGLEPLAPGERPTALTVAAVVAVLLAVANIMAWAAGAQVDSKTGSGGGVFIFAALMLVAAVGMWQKRYWAVLGFEALLALTVIIAGLSLVVASNLAAAVLCLTIVGLGGWLFWKLVRAMARIQMPSR